jgi:hypothetical protein
MSPQTMNPLQALLLVWAAGAVLSRDGSNLHVDAPKGAIPPPLVEALRANKAELLAILPDRVPLNVSADKGT